MGNGKEVGPNLGAMKDILDSSMPVIRAILNSNINLPLTNGINDTLVTKDDGMRGIENGVGGEPIVICAYVR